MLFNIFSLGFNLTWNFFRSWFHDIVDWQLELWNNIMANRFSKSFPNNISYCCAHKLTFVFEAWVTRGAWVTRWVVKHQGNIQVFSSAIITFSGITRDLRFAHILCHVCLQEEHLIFHEVSLLSRHGHLPNAQLGTWWLYGCISSLIHSIIAQAREAVASWSLAVFSFRGDINGFGFHEYRDRTDMWIKIQKLGFLHHPAERVNMFWCRSEKLIYAIMYN